MNSLGKSGAGRRGRRRLIAPELGELNLDSGESAERQLYGLLRRGIMDGTLLPGSSITGRSIAERFGLSPTPVRDALKRLEADGVVESRNKSAYFVIDLSREQYLEVLDVRQEIEGFAAARAAREATPDDVDRIEALNERYASTTDLLETIRINFAFHFEIYKLAGSQLLIDLIENLWMRIGPSMYLHAEEYDTAAVARNHQLLIKALRASDPGAAATALRRDLKDAIKAITPRLPSRSAVSIPPSAYNPTLQD